VLDSYRTASSNGTLPLYWINTAIMALFVEEVIFRGFLYQGWSHSLGTTGTILLTSILFGSMHLYYGWAGTFLCICGGLMLGWLRWRSGSVLVPMLMHFGQNLSAMVQ